MRLKTIQITNYRCIEDSLEFEIDNVTCLVGKNESGKTTLLQALYKLNPHRPEQGMFDRDTEYPRRHVNDYKERHPKEGANVVDTSWLLTAAEGKMLRERLGPAANALTSVSLMKGYDNELYWRFPDLDEVPIVAFLLGRPGLFDEEKAQLAKITSVAKLVESLAQLGDTASVRHTAFSADLAERIPNGDVSGVVISVLKPRIPKFVYFSQYDRMRGRIPLEVLQAKVEQSQTLDDREKTFLDFCAFANTSLAELASIQEYEKLRAKFEGASNKITEQIFEYWTQNPYLRVEFSREKGEPGDPAPYNTGHVFNIRLRNELHNVSVPFDDRSAGFVWFFSFLVLFTQLKRTYGGNVIVLLDEPGVSLHAKAQGDLLRFIDEKLASNHQVLYTTHSPFMIPPEKLSTVRTVQDVLIDRGPGKRPEIHGTKVRSDVLMVDADTLFPLQGALGYEITQTLFVGKNTLLVEGASDLVFIRAFAQQLADQKRTPLHSAWSICPVGGIEQIAAFVALFGGSKLNAVALVDYAAGAKKRTNDMIKLVEEILQAGRVFTMAKFAGQPEADIEDVVGVEAYLDIVNDCYGIAAGPDAIVMPVQRPPRIVKFVEGEMALKPALAEFNHFRPAEHLLTNRTALMPRLTGLADTLDRFEALFREINTHVKA